MSDLRKFEIEDHVVSTIGQDQLKAYAQASGDPNPIHLDEKVAKEIGLPGVIAHGMLIAAFLAKRAVEIEALQEKRRILKRSSTRFRAMTLLGDSISVGGDAEELSDGSLRIDLHAKSQSGEIKATALYIFN